MTEVNSNRVFQYQPDRNKYRNAEQVFSKIEGKVDLIEYLDFDGNVIHTCTVPGAWKTLGVYNGAVNRVLTEGMTYAQAVQSLKVSKQGQSLGRYNKARDYKIELSQGSLIISQKATGDYAMIMPSKKAAMTVSITAGSNYAGLIKRGSDLHNAIVKADQSLFTELIEQYLPKTVLAVAGKYQVELSPDTDIHQAKGALYVVMSQAGDIDTKALNEAKLIRPELADYLAWYKTSK